MQGTIVAFLFMSICIVVTLSHIVAPQDTEPKRYFDLSYPFDKDTIYFPGQRQYEVNMDYVNVSRNGYMYSAYSFCMAEHGGTHLDAPIHFDSNGWAVHQIPMASLIDVPAVLINVEGDVNGLVRPHEFVFNVTHIEAHEKTHGYIPDGSVVLIHTGWSKFWPDKIKYLGWDNSTENGATLNFPGLSEGAAKMLTKDRRIVGIGLDTASVDPGASQTFAAHVVLAKERIFNLENVANLGTLIAERKANCSLRLFILPLNIVGGTGAPTRILAYCE